MLLPSVANDPIEAVIAVVDIRLQPTEAVGHLSTYTRLNVLVTLRLRKTASVSAECPCHAGGAKNLPVESKLAAFGRA
jgi:hypothetical protein